MGFHLEIEPVTICFGTRAARGSKPFFFWRAAGGACRLRNPISCVGAWVRRLALNSETIEDQASGAHVWPRFGPRLWRTIVPHMGRADGRACALGRVTETSPPANDLNASSVRSANPAERESPPGTHAQRLGGPQERPPTAIGPRQMPRLGRADARRMYSVPERFEGVERAFRRRRIFSWTLGVRPWRRWPAAFLATRMPNAPSESSVGIDCCCLRVA